MKKSALIILILLLLTAVLGTAGCTVQKDLHSVLDIIVTKEGSGTYCVGDTMTVNLPNYQYEGYDWYVTYSNGLDIEKKIVSRESLGISEIETDFSSFIFTPTEEGSDNFVLKYMKEGDANSVAYEYSDVLLVDNTGGHTTSSFTFSGTLQPQVGQNVDITIKKTEATKDEVYKAAPSLITDGLTIVATSKTSANPEVEGDYGSDTWKVTAKESGMYNFGVVDDTDISLFKFFLTLNFRK